MGWSHGLTVVQLLMASFSQKASHCSWAGLQYRIISYVTVRIFLFCACVCVTPVFPSSLRPDMKKKKKKCWGSCVAPRWTACHVGEGRAMLLLSCWRACSWCWRSKRPRCCSSRHSGAAPRSAERRAGWWILGILWPPQRTPLWAGTRSAWSPPGWLKTQGPSFAYTPNVKTSIILDPPVVFFPSLFKCHTRFLDPFEPKYSSSFICNITRTVLLLSKLLEIYRPRSRPFWIGPLSWSDPTGPHHQSGPAGSPRGREKRRKRRKMGCRRLSSSGIAEASHIRGTEAPAADPRSSLSPNSAGHLTSLPPERWERIVWWNATLKTQQCSSHTFWHKASMFVEGRWKDKISQGYA